MTPPTHQFRGTGALFSETTRMRCFLPVYIPTGSAGWRSAQRIQIVMIAGGNHTIMFITPPYETQIYFNLLYQHWLLLYHRFPHFTSLFTKSFQQKITPVREARG